MTNEAKKSTLEDKIMKLFELAAKNPNKNEALEAAKKAQELMRKYDIQLANLKGQKEPICIHKATNSYGKSYRFRLARIIADNFAVKNYYINKMTVAFYGHKSNVVTACEVYDKLFNIIHRLADSEQTKVWKKTHCTKGVYNSFVTGFLEGLKSDLDKNCTALQIVLSEDVKTSFEEFCKDFTTLKHRGITLNKLNLDSYKKGYEEGASVMSRKEIK